MVTPSHIVPEWYFLPFYAILRSIPNKVAGVIAMFSAIVILFAMPFLGIYKCRSAKFSKLRQGFFFCFVVNFLLLGWLGSCVVEQPFVIISQISTIWYFVFCLFIIPSLGFLETKFIKNKVWGIQKMVAMH